MQRSSNSHVVHTTLHSQSTAETVPLDSVFFPDSEDFDCLGRQTRYPAAEMAPAVPIILGELSQLPDQTHGDLTPPEHRSSAPPHEQVNASWKSSATPSLNHISEPETTHLPLNEPLTSKIRQETRMELKLYWHETRKEEFCRKLKWAWTSCTDYMLSVDSSRDAVKSSLLRKFYNKPTTLYWAHSAQRYDACPRFIWGCIFKEWFRYQDYKPRMDFEHFFANPIRITGCFHIGLPPC